MKGREWEKIARRQLLPELGDEYTVKGSLVYRHPIEHILLGVDAETMYEATRLTFQPIVMPLFTPSDGVTTLIWDDLGATDVEGGEVSPGVVQLFVDARSLLQAHATPELLLASGSWRQPTNPAILEVEGYAHVLVGDAGPARLVLERVFDLSAEYEWELEVQERCRHLLDLLDRGLQAARAQLVEWENETLAAFGLERS